ncbi:lytic transglycosylase domain-containing protein [Planomonospora alba]|uniref:aggregation-promoting factor C-terminal-like domain-containing protein n=1 Tax=Planomonospora alba TaxID=161354 RepID=UPI0031E742C6
MTVVAVSAVVGSTATGTTETILTTAVEDTAPEDPTVEGTAERVYLATWSTGARPRPKSLARTAKGRNRAIAFRLVSRRAWSHDQFRCLDSLWTRESNWNHRAHNRHTGAYGIPQALPGSKMSDSGRDWRSSPVTQIRWGLRYIKQRYGSPCGAWGHFRSANWY